MRSGSAFLSAKVAVAAGYQPDRSLGIDPPMPVSCGFVVLGVVRVEILLGATAPT